MYRPETASAGTVHVAVTGQLPQSTRPVEGLLVHAAGLPPGVKFAGYVWAAWAAVDSRRAPLPP